MTSRTFEGLRSTRARTHPPRLIVLHWTGGTGGLARLYDVLRATVGPRTPDGLSVHYGIAPDGTSERWARDELVCLHAGVANEDALGIEVCSPGFSTGSAWERELASGVVREAYEDRIRGHRARMLTYTAEQSAEVARIVEGWCDAWSIPRRVPLEADGSLMRRQMTERELAAYSGVIGHYHCHATKCDPGPRPLLDLAKRWGIETR